MYANTWKTKYDVCKHLETTLKRHSLFFNYKRISAL